MKYDRIELLEALKNGSQGITPDEILEQSNSFIFEDGKMITFDDEIRTISDTDIKENMAVPADDFMKVMEKIPDKEVNITLKGSELLIKGKGKRSGITIMNEIKLPYKEVPEPKKMKKLPEDIIKYMVQAARTCGTNHTNPQTTHIHITPDYIEATDSYRIYRATIQTNIKKSILLSAQSVLAISYTELKKASIGNGWFHTITDKEVQISIRCAEMDYLKEEVLNTVLDVKGKKITLPDSLKQILQRASVMETQEKEARISIAKNKITIRTEKEGGWYEERKKIKYNSKPLKFLVNLHFLQEILSKTNQITVNENMMKIKKDNIESVIVLEGK